MNGNRAFYWALASAAAMVLGGFGPWATVLVFSVSGTSGDGWVPIVGGLAAGALLAVKRTTLRWPPVTTALLGLAGLVVAGADLADVSSLASKTDDSLLSGAVSPGWGLYLSVLGSASLSVASIVAAARTRRPAIAPAEAAHEDGGPARYGSV